MQILVGIKNKLTNLVDPFLNIGVLVASIKEKQGIVMFARMCCPKGKNNLINIYCYYYVLQQRYANFKRYHVYYVNIYNFLVLGKYFKYFRS